jgi:siroheme synthase-like protein
MAPGFPVLINLKGRLCLVVGGGDVAARKAETMAGRGGRVRVVSPEISPAARKLVEAGRAEWVKRPFENGDLAGAFLACAATGDPRVNRAVRDEARERGVLANVADDPEGSDYQVPSFFEDGPLLFALSTSGSSPAVAKALRRMIQSYLGPCFGEALQIINRFREEKVKTQIPDPQSRVRFWEESMTPDLLDMVRGGDVEGMERELERKLKDFKTN